MSEGLASFSRTNLKLPTIKLTCFRGNYVEVTSFKNTSESLIINSMSSDKTETALLNFHLLMVKLSA